MIEVCKFIKDGKELKFFRRERSRVQPQGEEAAATPAKTK